MADFDPGSLTVTGADASLIVERKMVTDTGHNFDIGFDAYFKRDYAFPVDAGSYEVIGADTKSDYTLETEAGVYSLNQRPVKLFFAPSKLLHKEAAVQGLMPQYEGKLDPFIKAILGLWHDDEDEVEEILVSRGHPSYIGYWQPYDFQDMLRRRREEREKEIEEEDDVITMLLHFNHRDWKRRGTSKRNVSHTLHAQYKRAREVVMAPVSVSAQLKINTLDPIKLIVTMKD